MTHLIDNAGRFSRSAAVLIRKGFAIEWESEPMTGNGTGKKKNASKTKYTCPECGQNAWAKPDANLLCGECSDDDDLVKMEPEDADAG